MTPSQLQQTIAQKLDTDWIKNPSVSVEVSTRRPFYVVGEVQKPGSYPYVTDMNVLNAIATAGGETYRANMHEFWIKRKRDGRIVRVEANQESTLQPGDTVIVRERYF
jgi:polysaccharide export outer membrane protein